MKVKFKTTMRYATILFLALLTRAASAQSVAFEGRAFEPINVKASVVKLDGRDVLRLERDLQALPFDRDNMASTVDEPTYAKLKGVSFVTVNRLLCPHKTWCLVCIT